MVSLNWQNNNKRSRYDLRLCFLNSCKGNSIFSS